MTFRSLSIGFLLALLVAACVIPGSGLLRTFTPALAMPAHYTRTTPSWQKSEVLSYVPEELLVTTTEENEEDVLGGFLEGKGTPGNPIGLGDIPWEAWKTPLARWVPLFVLLMLGMMGLSLVLHRQWTTHEHLVYPVAEFVRLLMVLFA